MSRADNPLTRYCDAVWNARASAAELPREQYDQLWTPYAAAKRFAREVGLGEPPSPEAAGFHVREPHGGPLTILGCHEGRVAWNRQAERLLIEAEAMAAAGPPPRQKDCAAEPIPGREPTDTERLVAYALAHRETGFTIDELVSATGVNRTRVYRLMGDDEALRGVLNAYRKTQAMPRRGHVDADPDAPRGARRRGVDAAVDGDEPED
jgi:hypothetical protein